MYLYFQARWRNGKATHVMEVLVSEDKFDELVQECFGITSEEHFEMSDGFANKAKELYEYLQSKEIKTKFVPVRNS